jgi:hypothetical protein
MMMMPSHFAGQLESARFVTPTELPCRLLSHGLNGRQTKEYTEAIKERSVARLLKGV